MATLDTETTDRLNALLEDERASVEIEVALVDGATELHERDAFDAMASADVIGCCALRERLEEANAPVTRQISGVALHILSLESYDERLLAFARHQAAIWEHAQSLLAAVTDRETRRVLQDISDAHARFDGWCEQRAREFAESRLLAFAGSPAGAMESVPPDGVVAGPPSTGVPSATLVAMQDAALACGPATDGAEDGSDAPRQDEGDHSTATGGTSEPSEQP